MLAAVWFLLLVTAAIPGSSSLTCRELNVPSMNAVVTLGETPSANNRCSGDLFRCSSASQTCLNTARPCVGGCDSEACVPFASLCDGSDDCRALAGGGGASADEAHCRTIFRTYRKTLRASIDVGRFMAFQVSLQTCAAYCFFHESCSMFSYAVTGNRQCKIGCDDCGWRTFTHHQDNAVLFNATAATRLLRARLAPADSDTSPAHLAGTSPLPPPGVCGLRNITGPDTEQFEFSVYGVDLGLPGFGPRRAAPADLRVVGLNGRRAVYGEYPWIAQLQLRDGHFRHHCGATVIGERYVVTAAHCLDHARSMYQVKVGQFDMRRLDAEEQTFAVQEMILHPGFVNNEQNSAGYPNDIAIIKLLPRGGRGIVFSDKVQPLCVTASEAGVELPEQCVVSGWGRTAAEGPLADVLAGNPVPTVSNAFCSSRHGYGSSFDGDIQVCAGNLTGGVDSCQGDSGGPLACYSTDAAEPHWYLAGVVSFGDGCGKPLKPGVYTRVSSYQGWIVGTLQYLESAGEA